MNILTGTYLLSFVPVIAFSLVLWAGIRGRKQFGRRPRHLLLAVGCLGGVGLLQLSAFLLPGLFPAGASFPLCSLSLLGYIAAFYFAEYSIHSQRLVRSFFIDDFRARLKALIIFLALLGALSLAAFLLHFNVIPADVADPAEVHAPYRLPALLFFSLGLAFALTVFRGLFLFHKGVIRRNLLFTAFLSGSLAGFAAVFLFLPGTAPAPLWLLGVNNIAFVIRVTDEYFFQRTANLDRNLQKMDESLRLKNDLIAKVVKSPAEEDDSIIRATVCGEIDRTRAFMAVPEQGISGTVIYTREGSVLRVNTAAHIDGFCVPVSRLEMLKLCKSKEQFDEIIMRTTFNVHAITATPAELLPSWGEKRIKEVLEAGREVVVSHVPAEMKGLHSLVAFYPVYDRDFLTGLIVVFKDNFDRLFPEEENALNAVVDNLTVIYSIIKGKQIQRERNRLQEEMEIARRIQTSILPKEIAIDGYECCHGMTTASEVGGDAYDLVKTEYGAYLGIGDVSGHGLPAGMTALIELTAFQAALLTASAFEKEVAPHELYEVVNQIICEINKNRIGSDKFMSANFFHFAGDKIVHAGAHLIGLLYRRSGNAVTELPELANRTAFMGLSPSISAVDSEGAISMEKDDILLLYTDGIIEAKNNFSHQFGLAPLKKLLADGASLPLDEIYDSIFQAVHEHAKDGDLKKYKGRLADDASLILIRKL